MREKVEKVLQKIYGTTLMISFFAGLLPLFPFIVAIIIGGGEGGTGEAIGTWLYKQYYPWVIALASIAILIGLISMYVGKKEAFSTKSFGIDKKKEETK
jgi:ABC-type sugar transport system permease subunit